MGALLNSTYLKRNKVVNTWLCANWSWPAVAECAGRSRYGGLLTQADHLGNPRFAWLQSLKHVRLLPQAIHQRLHFCFAGLLSSIDDKPLSKICNYILPVSLRL